MKANMTGIGSNRIAINAQDSAGWQNRAIVLALAVTLALFAVVALAVAVGATSVPAIRAARTSTVRALADAARPPRRTGWLIAISAGLPAPLLLGLRVAARRPRRTVLEVVSIAITVSGHNKPDVGALEADLRTALPQATITIQWVPGDLLAVDTPTPTKTAGP